MEKLTCEGARALFDEKLDGVIGADKGSLLDMHLAECETCRREYEALEKTRALLLDFAVDVPPELSAKVMEGIKKQPKHRVMAPLWLRPLVAVSAAALVCLTLIHSPLFELAGKKVAMDNAEMAAPELDGDLSGGLMDDVNNGSLKDKSEAYGDLKPQETPEKEQIEVKQVYAIADTDLVLLILNETEALICRDTGAETAEMLLAVTYLQKEDEFLVKASGKKLVLRLQNETLTPTDMDALGALLPK